MLSRVNYRKTSQTPQNMGGSSTSAYPSRPMKLQSFHALIETTPTNTQQSRHSIVTIHQNTATPPKTAVVGKKVFAPTSMHPPYFLENSVALLDLKINETIRHLNVFWKDFITEKGVVLNGFLACLAYNYDTGLSLEAFKSLEPAKIAFMIRYIDEAQICAQQTLKTFHPLRTKLLEILKNNPEVITYRISNASYYLAHSFPYTAPIVKPIPLYKHDLIRTVYPDIEAIPPHICGDY